MSIMKYLALVVVFCLTIFSLAQGRKSWTNECKKYTEEKECKSFGNSCRWLPKKKRCRQATITRTEDHCILTKVSLEQADKLKKETCRKGAKIIKAYK